MKLRNGKEYNFPKPKPTQIPRPTPTQIPIPIPKPKQTKKERTNKTSIFEWNDEMRNIQDFRGMGMSFC